MFATLHAGIGVKQTHSYARSLKYSDPLSDNNSFIKTIRSYMNCR